MLSLFLRRGPHARDQGILTTPLPNLLEGRWSRKPTAGHRATAAAVTSEHHRCYSAVECNRRGACSLAVTRRPRPHSGNVRHRGGALRAWLLPRLRHVQRSHLARCARTKLSKGVMRAHARRWLVQQWWCTAARQRRATDAIQPLLFQTVPARDYLEVRGTNELPSQLIEPHPVASVVIGTRVRSVTR